MLVLGVDRVGEDGFRSEDTERREEEMVFMLTRLAAGGEARDGGARAGQEGKGARRTA